MACAERSVGYQGKHRPHGRASVKTKKEEARRRDSVLIIGHCMADLGVEQPQAAGRAGIVYAQRSVDCLVIKWFWASFLTGELTLRTKTILPEPCGALADSSIKTEGRAEPRHELEDVLQRQLNNPWVYAGRGDLSEIARGKVRQGIDGALPVVRIRELRVIEGVKEFSPKL
jgi:hypothetical protein